ncbi:hypothetical protein D3C79_577700 [compost metagenome]
MRQLLQLLDHPRQVGQVVTFDFDQAQAGAGVLGQQGTYQRRLASTARAPQQRVVGWQAVDELVGVAAQLVALFVDADQVGQADVQADVQRQQVAAAAITLPARGQCGAPVDVRALCRQQGFKARQYRFGAVQKSDQASVHDDS